ncbi:hypothetical protein BKA62DRAFT_204120 [Auriculariales sp. MPI-PUGE-AT-0066]|nr:hypothetical protein BKA62DRAFT_204120 [Auriculariales sp. MPI-PUGE-AT-0066]
MAESRFNAATTTSPSTSSTVTSTIVRKFQQIARKMRYPVKPIDTQPAKLDRSYISPPLETIPQQRIVPRRNFYLPKSAPVPVPPQSHLAATIRPQSSLKIQKPRERSPLVAVTQTYAVDLSKPLPSARTSLASTTIEFTSHQGTNATLRESLAPTETRLSVVSRIGSWDGTVEQGVRTWKGTGELDLHPGRMTATGRDDSINLVHPHTSSAMSSTNNTIPEDEEYVKTDDESDKDMYLIHDHLAPAPPPQKIRRPRALTIDSFETRSAVSAASSVNAAQVVHADRVAFRSQRAEHILSPTSIPHPPVHLPLIHPTTRNGPQRAVTTFGIGPPPSAVADSRAGRPAAKRMLYATNRESGSSSSSIVSRMQRTPVGMASPLSAVSYTTSYPLMRSVPPLPRRTPFNVPQIAQAPPLSISPLCIDEPVSKQHQQLYEAWHWNDVQRQPKRAVVSSTSSTAAVAYYPL